MCRSFGYEFYELAKAALKPGGSLAAQGAALRALRTLRPYAWPRCGAPGRRAGESVWLHIGLIKQMMALCRSKFPVVEYAGVQIPTCAFPFLLGIGPGPRRRARRACPGSSRCRSGRSDWRAVLLEGRAYELQGAEQVVRPSTAVRQPCAARLVVQTCTDRREVGRETEATLQYYSPAVHRAAFVLPEFARRALE